METRNISLTLEKAKEWYNSGSADLKEVVLQAYTEDELKTIHFSDIKTFKDAVLATGADYDVVLHHIEGLNFQGGKHLIAIYKLDIIRKALNPNWKPKLNSDSIYYPWARYYLANEAREAANNNGWALGKSFIVNGEKYTLVGGDYGGCDRGLGHFSCGYGDVDAYLGLLCCETGEIARHMSKYFSKEIFEACYTHHNNYEWA